MEKVPLILFNTYMTYKMCSFLKNFVDESFAHYLFEKYRTPVEKLSLFVVSVATDNISAIQCYKRTGFIDITPNDALSKHFNNFWKTTNFKHMIVSKQTIDNDKSNANKETCEK
jgi:hypothetical protein